MKETYLLDEGKTAKIIIFQEKEISLSLKILFLNFGRNHSQLKPLEHY